MLMIESVAALRFCPCSFEAAVSRRISRSSSVSMPWNKFQRLAQGSYTRNNFVKNRVRASAEGLSGSSWSPTKQHVRPLHYHPFEDIAESDSMQSGEARLTPAKTTRTIIEVNRKATVMFSGFFNDEVDENICWPDLPYVNDECGNIYFVVKNEEDILQSLTADDNLVGWISILEGKEDQWVSDESLGDWTKLETMHSSYPMYFAKKLAEAVVEEDFTKAKPDSIAHSAAKIVSRLKAGGEKTSQALKSLCWRCKGIQAEEAALIGIDTLGFDLRICSGTQVQTLRFTFKATSEYSAEQQLDDLLFPETHQKLQKRMGAHKTEL